MSAFSPNTAEGRFFPYDERSFFCPRPRGAFSSLTKRAVVHPGGTGGAEEKEKENHHTHYVSLRFRNGW